MMRVANFPSEAPSGASSAASEGGPALRIRALRPTLGRSTYKPGLLDVGLLGVTTVFGGQYFSWNAALAGGMIPATTAFAIVSGAYLVLVFSLAEIASLLPFSGGGYAVTRKTLGFYGGFLVGAIDVLEFLTYVAASVLSLAAIVVTAVPSASGFEPLVWIVCFLSAGVLQTRSPTLFWRANALLAIASLFILLLYCLGSLRLCNLRENTVPVMDIASRTARDKMPFVSLVRVLPLSAWFFIGADTLVLSSDHVTDVRVTLPRAQRRCIVMLVATSILTFFVTSASPPTIGPTTDALAPLSFGFARLLGMSERNAVWLSVPAIYGTLFGFVWAYGRLVAALAASGLLPRSLAAAIRQQMRRNQNLSSRTAIGTGSVLSFGICLIVHYGHRSIRELTNVCLGFAFLSYIGQTIGYLVLHRDHSSALARSGYCSPFGAIGAYSSLAVWALCLFSIVGFQDSSFVELAVLASVLAFLTLYYFLYAQHHQLISADERDVAMAASKSTVRTAPSTPSPSPPPAEASLAPTSDADGSFHSTGGSLRMPQIVRAGSKLNDLVEVYPDVADDLDEPYVAPYPPSAAQPDQDILSASFTAGPRPVLAATPLRRAGSDSALASNVMLSPIVLPPVVVTPPTVSLLSSSGFGRSFLVRHGRRLERLREETDRDLRSAMSGIWSERSQHRSRGRAG